jgi:hypothetical protein
MSSTGFEPTIPASKWPQTHALDRAATGIGSNCFVCQNMDNRLLEQNMNIKFLLVLEKLYWFLQNVVVS